MITLTVNGKETHFDGDPDMPLLWFLRDIQGLTGTKFGCGAAPPWRLHDPSRRHRRALVPDLAGRRQRRRA